MQILCYKTWSTCIEYVIESGESILKGLPPLRENQSKFKVEVIGTQYLNN